MALDVGGYTIDADGPATAEQVSELLMRAGGVVELQGFAV